MSFSKMCVNDDHRGGHEHPFRHSFANEEFYETSAAALQEAGSEGSLVVSDIVYVELCVHFDTQRQCDSFLQENEIRVLVSTRETQFLASRAWRTYHQQGGRRERVLPDFQVGAHAEKQASRLLSRDRSFYRQMFPSLNLRDPGREGTS